MQWASTLDPKVLYKVASKKIGQIPDKISKAKGYIMRLMDRKPEMGEKFKKYHLLARKNKGISIFFKSDYMYMHRGCP